MITGLVDAPPLAATVNVVLKIALEGTCVVELITWFALAMVKVAVPLLPV
jgi:hypothetical protein